jgi:hypothetical protein
MNRIRMAMDGKQSFSAFSAVKTLPQRTQRIAERSRLFVDPDGEWRAL